MSTELSTRLEGQCLILTLDGPATRNALSLEVYSAGLEALDRAEGDAAIRAVILQGAGGHFCSGGDLRRIALRLQEPAEAQRAAIQAFHALIEAMQCLSKPVVAAVEGHAAGGGLSLALACDGVVASRQARFTVSYGKVGLTPDGGATWQLGRGLPRALALEAVWLAQGLSAERLHQLGLVNRVVEPGHALTQALAFCAELAEMAPNAIASAKHLLTQAPDLSLRSQLDLETEAFLANLHHPNAAEGIAAFQARRTPRFGP
jgi:enoyl-CoA hydratase/carnithine racemase